MSDPLYFRPRCPFCGEEVPVKGFHDHMLWNHPEYLNLKRQEDLEKGWAFGKFALAALVVFFAGVALVFIVSVPIEWGLAGVFATAMGVMALGGVYAHRATSAHTGALNSLERHCQICDAEMPGTEMARHIGAVHPAEERYLREARAFAIGCLVLALAAMVSLGILLLPYATAADPWSARGFPEGLLGVGLLTWGVMMYVWKRYVDTRHVARVRQAWTSAHPSARSPPPSQ